MQDSPLALSFLTAVASLGLLVAGACGWFDAVGNWFEDNTRETAFAESVCCAYCVVIGALGIVLELNQASYSMRLLSNYIVTLIRGGSSER